MFHLAIPTHDIKLSKKFYSNLGFKIGRSGSQFVIINFFGHQVVCHLDPREVPDAPQMYPRHFGLIVEEESNYEKLYAKAKASDVEFFKEDFRRYEGDPAEHRSFFLQDPSNNLIEFKWYKDQATIF